MSLILKHKFLPRQHTTYPSESMNPVSDHFTAQVFARYCPYLECLPPNSLMATLFISLDQPSLLKEFLISPRPRGCSLSCAFIAALPSRPSSFLWNNLTGCSAIVSVCIFPPWVSHNSHALLQHLSHTCTPLSSIHLHTHVAQIQEPNASLME